MRRVFQRSTRSRLVEVTYAAADRRHENDISRGLAPDADKYVVKLCNLVEPVARLKRLPRC